MSIAKRFAKSLFATALARLFLLTGCESNEEAADKSENDFVVVNEKDEANEITVPINPDANTNKADVPPPIPNTPAVLFLL